MYAVYCKQDSLANNNITSFKWHNSTMTHALQSYASLCMLYTLSDFPSRFQFFTTMFTNSFNCLTFFHFFFWFLFSFRTLKILKNAWYQSGLLSVILYVQTMQKCFKLIRLSVYCLNTKKKHEQHGVHCCSFWFVYKFINTY